MILQQLRQKRNFQVEHYIVEKCLLINKFLKEENLDSVVLGVSGGIDSAVTLALLVHASDFKDSPLKKILGVTMPIIGNGSTGQSESLSRSQDLANMIQDYFGAEKFEFRICDLTNPYQAYLGCNSLSYDSFSEGQLLSIVRTPFLYFQAANLQIAGYRSIVCGTTNRDEGAYIGFFGKASDAMVDLQPIADIHKSEVYQIARYFNLPESIINEAPRGDVFDGRTDQEMIGASYDDVELFTLMKDYRENFTEEDFKSFVAFQAIEHIHQKNAHKYRVGFPSRFLDVMPRHIEGGW